MEFNYKEIVKRKLSDDYPASWRLEKCTDKTAFKERAM